MPYTFVCFTLCHFHAASRRAEIGYVLGRPYWGLGHIHEALQALLRYAFQILDLNRLKADIDPRNRASAKTLDRLGFQREGHLQARWIVNGEISNTWLYGLLQREWQKPSTTT
jgi:RimJ/RimL family protein N-acetyltransferase